MKFTCLLSFVFCLPKMNEKKRFYANKSNWMYLSARPKMEPFHVKLWKPCNFYTKFVRKVALPKNSEYWVSHILSRSIIIRNWLWFLQVDSASATAFYQQNQKYNIEHRGIVRDDSSVKNSVEMMTHRSKTIFS